MPIKLKSVGGGEITLDAPNTASNYTVTLPASNATVLNSESTLDATKLSGAVPASSLTNGYSGPNIEIFSSSGTWTVPVGITKILVYIYGGGGGGLAGYTTLGGYGGTGIAYITNLTQGTVISFTIGAGASAGGSGGTSSFGTYITATGGAVAGTAANGSNGTSSYSITNGYILSNSTNRALPNFYNVSTDATRPAASGAGSPLAWALNSVYSPGARGQSSTTVGASSGGVGGGLFIIY